MLSPPHIRRLTRVLRFMVRLAYLLATLRILFGLYAGFGAAYLLATETGWGTVRIAGVGAVIMAAATATGIWSRRAAHSTPDGDLLMWAAGELYAVTAATGFGFALVTTSILMLPLVGALTLRPGALGGPGVAAALVAALGSAMLHAKVTRETGRALSAVLNSTPRRN